MIDIDDINNSLSAKHWFGKKEEKENANLEKKMYHKIYYQHKRKNQSLEEAVPIALERLNAKKLNEIYDDPKDLKSIINQRYRDKQIISKINCPCGSIVSNINFNYHIKSKRHNEFEQTQTSPILIFVD